MASVLAALLVIAGAQVVTSSPAHAVAGRVRIQAPVTATDSTPFKVSNAFCPIGTRIMGGGGWAFDNDANRVHLTRLEPVTTVFQDRYAVEAEAEPGFTGNWWLQAYAICAAGPAGYQIVTSPATTIASNTFVTQLVDCPAGKKLIGTGAKILGGNREVGLQRSSGDFGMTRSLSTAREDASGFAGNWTLTAYGVCSFPFAGANLSFSSSAGSAGSVSCSFGQVHSVGGGGPFFDAGPVFLMKLFPSSVATRAELAMSGTPSHGITNIDAFCLP